MTSRRAVVQEWFIPADYMYGNASEDSHHIWPSEEKSRIAWFYFAMKILKLTTHNQPGSQISVPVSDLDAAQIEKATADLRARQFDVFTTPNGWLAITSPRTEATLRWWTTAASLADACGLSPKRKQSEERRLLVLFNWIDGLEAFSAPSDCVSVQNVKKEHAIATQRNNKEIPLVGTTVLAQALARRLNEGASSRFVMKSETIEYVADDDDGIYQYEVDGRKLVPDDELALWRRESGGVGVFCEGTLFEVYWFNPD